MPVENPPHRRAADAASSAIERGHSAADAASQQADVVAILQLCGREEVRSGDLGGNRPGFETRPGLHQHHLAALVLGQPGSDDTTGTSGSDHDPRG